MTGPRFAPMRAAAIWTLALSSLILLLLGGGVDASAAVRSHPLHTGVTNLGTNDPLAFARTRGVGARLVRIQLYWGGAAPRIRPPIWDPANPNDEAYDWAASDEAVRNAVAAGLTPVLQVDGAPKWAQRCQSPPVVPSAVCDPDPAELRSFAAAAASRYSGTTPGVPRVRYFQALNEPNLSNFFFPQFEVSGKVVSPFLYRELINAFYAGVKAGQPSALVIGAGLGPVAVPKWTVGPMRFARSMLCMTGGAKPRPMRSCDGVNLDIFAIQPYTTGGPTHESKAGNVQIGDLAKLRKLIAAADAAGHIKGAFKRTPLWITEFSWDSKPPDPNGLPEKILTRWVAEALHTAWLAGVSEFFWYSLRDDPRDPGEPYSASVESGLYTRAPNLAEDQRKPFAEAFRFPFVAYPGDSLGYWGRTPSSSRGRIAIQLWKGGKWRTAEVVKADRHGIFRGRIKTRYGAGRSGSVRALFGKQRSPSFSMKPVADFRHPPFG